MILRLFFLLFIILIAEPALAQSLSLNLGEGATEGTMTARVIHIIALLTILTLAPSIIIMVTSFTRIIVVLSFLRSALGLQQTPPNPVLISLALFLTFFIMAPTFEQAYKDGIKPLSEETLTLEEAFPKITKPLHRFMYQNVRKKDVELFLDIANEPAPENPDDISLKVLTPAFMISELRRAFEIGFLLFVPFLLIDMLIASTLMSMGMMMLPPVIISLPFKLIFFVLVDGWYLIAGALVRSYGGG